MLKNRKKMEERCKWFHRSLNDIIWNTLLKEMKGRRKERLIM